MQDTNNRMDRAKKLEIIFEFLIFGIVIGVIEDVVAVKLTTGEPITLKIVGIIVLIAIPFAILGELFVDRFDFSQYIQKFIKEDNKHN